MTPPPPFPKWLNSTLRLLCVRMGQLLQHKRIFISQHSIGGAWLCLQSRAHAHRNLRKRSFHSKLKTFLSHVLLSHFGAALKSRHSTLCLLVRHFSSTLSLPNSFIFLPRNTRLPLPTPASLTSPTVPLGKVALLARHVKSFSPHLSLVRPPSAIPPREQSQEKVTKCTPPPPFFTAIDFYKPRKGKEIWNAGAHLRPGPAAAGKAEGIPSSIRSENQEQQVVPPGIPPLSHTAFSSCTHPGCGMRGCVCARMCGREVWVCILLWTPAGILTLSRVQVLPLLRLSEGERGKITHPQTHKHGAGRYSPCLPPPTSSLCVYYSTAPAGRVRLRVCARVHYMHRESRRASAPRAGSRRRGRRESWIPTPCTTNRRPCCGWPKTAGPGRASLPPPSQLWSISRSLLCF